MTSVMFCFFLFCIDDAACLTANMWTVQQQDHVFCVLVSFVLSM